MRFVPSVLTSAVVVSCLLRAHGAAAQEASPTGKGVVGGALLGGELVLAIEAAFKVQSTWAYIGGGVAGAAAGGVGGYFVEKEGSARTTMIMLAAGLTLAIPTTVAVLSATSYEPPANYVQDQGPSDEPVADPPKAVPAPAPVVSPPASVPPPAPATTPSGRAPTRGHMASRQPHRLTPPALIDVEPTRLSLSLPAVEIRDVYSRLEVAMGAHQATEVRIPVLNVLF
jgi:hypothetical protein